MSTITNEERGKPRPRTGRDRIVSVAEVKGWYDAGWTYRAMAEEHERLHGVRVSLTAFSELRVREGWEPRIRRNTDLIPWAVKPEHRFHYFLTQLRAEGRARQGKPLSTHAQANLDAFKRDRLGKLYVVDYDPDSEDGFTLVARRRGEDMVRQPKRKTTKRPRG